MVRLIKIGLVTIILSLLLGCEPRMDHIVSVESPAPIYPDYKDIVVPFNIAPLNFTLVEDADYMNVVVKGREDSIKVVGRKDTNFSLSQWRGLLTSEIGHDLSVEVTAHVDGKWIKYPPFKFTVANEPIDTYLSYTLEDAGYNGSRNIKLCERNLENFDVRTVCDNSHLSYVPIKNHVYGNGNREGRGISMFQLRGGNCGTIMIKDGEITKYDLKVPSMVSAPEYGDFSPGNRYGAFTTKVKETLIHSAGKRKAETIDREADVYVVDFDTRKVVESPFLMRKDMLESSPAFSPDGKWLYFCAAIAPSEDDTIKELRYSIYRLPFDSAMAQFGDSIELVWNASQYGSSASNLKFSPDGKLLLFNATGQGAYPEEDPEAELRLLHLETNQIDFLPQANSSASDNYHSWSSNGRWVVFASKREDGKYSRPYISYVDTLGRVSKSFLVPKKRPDNYENSLKSYETPDLSPRPITASQREIEDACR